MNCTKSVTLIGYIVRYVDLREAKPRTTYHGVYVLEKDSIEALNQLGLNTADFITARYERGGYHVIGVERIPKKRTAEFDLLKVWQAAEPTATI